MSVHDGEEWTVKGSRKFNEICDALATTDSDILRFRAADDKSVGFVEMVWGNAEDVISDCGDNDAMAALTDWHNLMVKA